MMWDRVSFKRAGKANFKRNYWPCVAVSVLLMILGGSGSNPSLTYRLRQGDWSRYFSGDPAGGAFFGALMGVLVAIGISLAVVAIVIRLLVCNPFAVGAARFYMENRNADAGFGTVKIGFANNFGNVVLTQFLRDLYILLWSLLFVIPGVVQLYAYFAVPYILAENPDLDHKRVLQLSKAMTKGYKGDIFVTDLSFILWEFLSGITWGIVGIFYVNPYVHGTQAEIYAFLRERALANGLADSGELPGFGEGPAHPEDTPNF